eukprot:3176783-Prorocentrum_lima.AAC.1
MARRNGIAPGLVGIMMSLSLWFHLWVKSWRGDIKAVGIGPLPWGLPARQPGYASVKLDRHRLALC